MVKFYGIFTAKVDDKGRVVFPSGLKDQMLRCLQQDGSDSTNVDWRFVVKKDIWESCLSMFCFSEWERESDDVKSRINFLDRGEAAFWREYTRNLALVEPEPKLGRISIPKTLLKSVGTGKEIVFYGNGHKIEIWDKERFTDSELTQEQYISLADSLSKKKF